MPVLGQVSLDLLTVHLDESAQVQFEQSYSETVREHPEGWHEWPCGDTATYRVCADPQEVHPTRYQNRFAYVLYVRPRIASVVEGMQRFRLLANPIGRFKDRQAAVDFTIEDEDGNVEKGSLRLPVHSISSDHFLSYQLDQNPVIVQIGRGDRIAIDLENQLEDLHLFIENKLRVVPDNPNLWISPPVAQLEPSPSQEQEELRLAPTSKQAGTLRLKADPVPSKALLTSAIPFETMGSDNDRRSGIHERLTVYVLYHTRGGLSRELPVEVSIRFWPSLWALIAAVLAGAFLGSLVRPLLGSGFRDWPWEVAAALVMAPIAWSAALLLVRLDSRLIIFGLDLDPYQLIPAGLLGVVVALGGGKGAPLLKKMRLRGLDGGSRKGQDSTAEEEEPS